jgi:hypothetical protein
MDCRKWRREENTWIHGVDGTIIKAWDLKDIGCKGVGAVVRF